MEFWCFEKDGIPIQLCEFGGCQYQLMIDKE